MQDQLTLPEPGLFFLQGRRGVRTLANIPVTPGSSCRLRVLFGREDVHELFAQLGADPSCIPDDEYLTEDELFDTPKGWAFKVTDGDPAKLHELLYREPTSDDPGGWLRRPLNAGARARGLSRAESWRDVE